MGRAKNIKGVTLLELLTAMAILAVVGALATPILYLTYRSFEASNVQLRLQNHVHLAMREIVDYIESSAPLPVTGGVGAQSVVVNSPAQITVYNFVNPSSPNPPVPADFGNASNYTATVIAYSAGQITSVRTGGGLPGITRILGIQEQRLTGSPGPVRFSNVEFTQGVNRNDIGIMLEAEAQTNYGNIERATLTVVATARGRRAGD